jgi:hypothetical protein
MARIGHIGWVAAAFVAALMTCAAPAFAQTSCATLMDEYCVTDHCVLPQLEVASPCIVDFGDRVVEVQGMLRIPAGGVLSFTARRIETSAVIRGGDGAEVTLTTTTGAVSVNRPVGIYGGHLVFDGAVVAVFGAIKAKTRPGGPAGSLTVQSDDWIQFTHPIRMNGRLGSADGGNVVMHANGEIRVDDIEVTGMQGGGINLDTTDAHGVVCFHRGCKMRARGGSSGAGSIRVTAPNIVLTSVKLQADGGGGEVRLRALSYQASLDGYVDVRGGGGIFEASAPFLVTAHGTYRAAPGGCIGLAAPTVDTTGAAFDTAPVPDCPGSPGGAFVD